MNTLATFLLITQLVTSFTYQMDTFEAKSKIMFANWKYEVLQSLPKDQRSAVNEVLNNAFDAEIGKRLAGPGYVKVMVRPGKVVVWDSGVVIASHIKKRDPFRYFGGAGVGLLQAEILSSGLTISRNDGHTEVELKFDKLFERSA